MDQFDVVSTGHAFDYHNYHWPFRNLQDSSFYWAIDCKFVSNQIFHIIFLPPHHSAPKNFFFEKVEHSV